MFKKIEKKDLIYWLGFSIVLWLLSSDFGQGNQALLDNWTFAGTVVSIILAVIAIIITVDQGSTAVDSSKRLEKASEKIEVVSTKLEKISVDELFENLEKKIETINTTLDERMEVKFSGIAELINSSYHSSKSVNGIFTKDEWKKRISISNVKKTSIMNVILLYFYLSYKENKRIDTYEIGKWLRKGSKDESNDDLLLAYMNLYAGMFIGFSFLGIFSGDGLYEIMINNVSSEFQEAIEEIIQEAEEENSEVLSHAREFFK